MGFARITRVHGDGRVVRHGPTMRRAMLFGCCHHCLGDHAGVLLWPSSHTTKVSTMRSWWQGWEEAVHIRRVPVHVRWEIK